MTSPLLTTPACRGPCQEAGCDIILMAGQVLRCVLLTKVIGYLLKLIIVILTVKPHYMTDMSVLQVQMYKTRVIYHSRQDCAEEHQQPV